MVSPGTKRTNHKWAMCAVKGGRCIACQKRVTDANFQSFHFDHKIKVNDSNDRWDRWCGAIRDWPPFTEKWFAWAETVDLICEPCHQDRHRQEHKKQGCLLSLIEQEEVQTRLANHDTQTINGAIQQELF